MAKKCGPYAVTVHDYPEPGKTTTFLPGDDIDAAAAKLIDNPLAYEGGDDAAEPMPTVGSTAPPPPPGSKGATKEAWQNYANQYGVAIRQDMSVKDIADACAAAGIAV